MKRYMVPVLLLTVMFLSAQEVKLMFGGAVPQNKRSQFLDFRYISAKDPMIRPKADLQPWNFNPNHGAAMSSGNNGSVPADSLLEQGIAFRSGTLVIPYSGKTAAARIFTGDWFVGWKRLNKNKPQILIAVNGKKVYESSMDRKNTYAEWCRLDEYVFSRKDSIWDRLVRPVLQARTFTVDNPGSKIEIELKNILLSAVVIAPDEESLDRISLAMERESRKQFAARYPWKPQPDEPMPRTDRKDYLLVQKQGTDDVYPWSRPRQEEVSDTIRVFAARGEQEMFRFGILPLRDLPDLDIRLGDFTGKGGRIALSGNADLWRERYKERGSESLSGRFSDLRRLDPRSCILQKNRPQNGEAGTPRMYVLDVRVPENAAPGNYFAPLAILSNGKTVGQAKLQLRVLPFKLNYEGSASYNFQQGDMLFWASWMRGWTKEGVRRELEERCRFIAKYKFHNDYFCPWGYQYPFRYGTIVGKPGERRFTQTPEQAADLDWWFLKAAKTSTAGFCLIKASYLMLNCGWNHRNLFKELYSRKKITPERNREWDTDLKDLENLIRQITEIFHRRGYPEPYWYYAGELDNEGVRGVQEGVRLAKLIRRAGAVSLVTINGPLAARATPAVYDHIWANPAAPITENLVREIKNHGHGFGAHNCGDTRFQAGFQFWRTGAEARHQETVFYANYLQPLVYLPWNYNTALVYPAPDGSARPSLMWLNYRDGRDDYLYLFNLEQRIGKVRKNSPARREAEEFLKHLRKKIHFDPREYHVEGFNAEEGTAQINSREWNSMSLERYRWKIATLIMALEQDK